MHNAANKVGEQFMRRLAPFSMLAVFSTLVGLVAVMHMIDVHYSDTGILEFAQDSVVDVSIDRFSRLAERTAFEIHSKTSISVRTRTFSSP
jgi:hypothetical protein